MSRKTQIILGFILFLVGTILFWIQIDTNEVLIGIENINLLKSFYFIGIIFVPFLFFLEYYKRTIKTSKIKKKIWLSILLIIFLGALYFLSVQIMKFYSIGEKTGGQEYKEITVETVLDIKPFSNKKLAFYITAQQIEDREVSAKNVYFEDKEGKRNIYHESVYKYGDSEEKIREDLLTIYSKPKEKGLEDFLYEIITTAYKDYYKDLEKDFGEAEKERLEDIKKVCKVEEYYYGTYIFSQDKSFDEYLKNKYGEGLHTEIFCPGGAYTYFQKENLIIGNTSTSIDAVEVKVYRDPTGSRLRLID